MNNLIIKKENELVDTEIIDEDFIRLICQHFIGQKIYNLTNHFKT